MKYLKKHKKLIVFLLVSIFVLLVYDLFNAVEKRGAVTATRNFPRFYRSLLLIILIWYNIYSVRVKGVGFNKYFTLLYAIVIFNLFFDSFLEINSLVNVSKMLLLIFGYFFFYKFYFVFENEHAMKWLNRIVYLSVVILSSHIIASRFNLLGGEILSKISGNNNAYVLLSFLPLIYLNTNKKQQKMLFFMLIIGVLMAIKRGAIVAMFVCFIVSFFMDRRVQIKKKPFYGLKRFFIIVFSITFLGVIYSKNADLFQERMEDLSDSKSFGSGRGNVYSLIWDDWVNSNSYKTYLIGDGYNSVQKLTKRHIGAALMAHSDFLTILHSFGILGISIWLAFLGSQIKIVRFFYRKRHPLLIPCLCLFIIYFFKSIYSANIEQPAFIYLLIGFGVINANYARLKYVV